MQNEQESPPPFVFLKIGEFDPVLGNKVHTLISQSQYFCIYLDEDLSTQWFGHIEITEKHSRVLNQVAILETKSEFIEDIKSLYSVRRKIGDALARAFDGHFQSADELFEFISKEVEIKNNEISRGWYFNTTYLICIALFILLLLAWAGRESISFTFGMKAFHVGIGAIIGAQGALLSVISRSEKIKLDATSGKSIHVTEGICRVTAGLIGGAILALLLKAGLIFSGIKLHGESKLAFLMILSFSGGLSERIIPSFIKKLESKTKVDI